MIDGEAEILTSLEENYQDQLRSEQETIIATLQPLQSTALISSFESKIHGSDVTCSADIYPTAEMTGQGVAELDMNKPTSKGVRRFSTLADKLIPWTPRGAEKCRTFYLDRSMLQISNHMIGCSRTSEIFGGVLDGRVVAVKQLTVDIVDELDRKELKDLMSEICLMC